MYKEKARLSTIPFSDFAVGDMIAASSKEVGKVVKLHPASDRIDGELAKITVLWPDNIEFDLFLHLSNGYFRIARAQDAVKYFFISQIGGHPAMEMLGRYAVEVRNDPKIIQDNLADLFPSYNWSAILARDVDNKLVGVLSFQKEDWNNAIATTGAYVVPERRCEGINAGMFNALLIYAKKEKVGRIRRFVNKGNEASLKSIRKSGSIEVGTEFIHYLDTNNEEILDET